MFTRIITLVIIALVGVATLRSHPGIGIVMDSGGNIYYTDLKHVWKLAPDGRKSIAVRNVHTHELYIDQEDNLYGEHLWYEGERTDTWGHRVWRLSPDGELTDVIPAREGFREDYGDFFYVRDRHGNMYWADRGEMVVIRKRSPEGMVSVIVQARFRDVRWMTVTSEGTVYLIDRHDLVRITSNGKIHVVAHDLAQRSRTLGFVYDKHAVMGLWTDAGENVYAAVTADRLVKRIRPDGRVDVVARSRFPWAPTGGLIAPNGDLLVLEVTDGTKARVRRIHGNGNTHRKDGL
jgi:hypothetical protein